MGTSSRTVKQRAYHEMKEFLVIALYLWAVFALFQVYKAVVLAEHGIDFAFQGCAILNAWVLAKVMVVGKRLLADKANDGPLIYPILRNSGIFSVLLTCFKILEAAAIGLYRGESFQQSVDNIFGGNWTGILVLSVLLFVVLIPLFAFAALQRILGQGKLEQILFRGVTVVKAA